MEVQYTLDTTIYFKILVLITFVILIFSLKKTNKVEQMNINYTTCMKGLMAILILFNHFSLRINNLGWLRVFKNIGYPAVAVFLFITGYVETHNHTMKKNKYFDGFIRKKIGRLYIPWIISTIFFAVAFKIMNINTILKGLFLFKTIYRKNTFNWFVIYIIYYYTTIYLISNIIKDNSYEKNSIKKKYIALSIISSFLWLLFCIYTKQSPNWYINSFSTTIGTIIALYNNEITKRKKNNGILNLGIFICLSAILYVVPNFIHIKVLKELIYIADMIIVCISTWKLSLVFDYNSKMFNFVGKLSYEIFLYGTGIFIIYYSHFSHKGFGLIIVILIVIILSYITNKLSNLLTKKMLK